MKLKDIIPADHSITAQESGIGEVARMILRAGLNYTRTMKYLLRKRRGRDLFNFLYTKTLVPTGEGTGELAYYLLGPLLRKYPQLVPYPRYIEVEISSRCNKRCRQCERTHWDMPNVDLSFKDYKNLVDQFTLRWINETGEGDSFLNKDYLKMLKYAKAKGASTYLVDSFDLIDVLISCELVCMGIDGIYISMDGATKQTYEKVKEGCNFDRTIKNIQQFLIWKKHLSSPIPEVCFRYIVNRENMDEMADFVRLIRSIAPRRDWGDGAKIHFAGLLDYPEIHDLYLPTIPQKNIQEAVNVSKSDPECLPVVFAHSEEDKLPPVESCLAWMEPYFGLVPRHMSLPCCAVLMSNDRWRLEEYSFSNYTHEPFRKTWDHPYYRWFRQSVNNPTAPLPELCRNCRAYSTKIRAKNVGVDKRTRRDFE